MAGRPVGCPTCTRGSSRVASRRARPGRAALVLGAVFTALLGLLAAALWGTVVEPRAFEVRGEVVARPAPGLLLVRHEPVAALGMAAMEMMAVDADPARLEAAGLRPGDRVRLAVRPRGDRLLLVNVQKLP